MEDAVASVGADGEGLGVVFEGVGRRLCAFVVDLEGAALFEQDELRVGAGALDAAGSYVAGYAEVAGVGFVAERIELRDGDVILFGALHAGVGEPARPCPE